MLLSSALIVGKIHCIIFQQKHLSTLNNILVKIQVANCQFKKVFVENKQF